MRFSSVVVTLAVSGLVLVSGSEIVHAKNAKVNYEAELRRTSSADMTRLFSASGWVDMPFEAGAIQNDPNLSVWEKTQR